MNQETKNKKLGNKGFSLVELIIVIAIMAILAGALAPQLMKYLGKSKKSVDVQTGQTIASAVQAAMAGEDVYTAAVAIASGSDVDLKVSDIYGNSNLANEKGIVGKAIKENLDASKAPVPKSLGTDAAFIIKFEKVKDADGKEITGEVTFKVYAVEKSGSSNDATNQLYPEVGSDFK